MITRVFIILMISLVLESIGVVLLSKGIKQIGEPASISAVEIARLIKRGVANPNVLLGVFFEAMFFAGFLMMLSQSDVSFIWPLTSLSFVVTTLAAKFILHEYVSGIRWMGVACIMIGAALISYSEHNKPGKEAAPASLAAKS